MNSFTNQSLPTIIFEHACKHDYKDTVNHILENGDSVSQIIPNITSEKNQVKPVFMFLFLLKKLYSSNLLAKIATMPEELTETLSILIDLLETTFRQCNFISLKKYFTLISELKLLDLLSLIVRNLNSSQVLQMLNQYFPRWTLAYRTTIEKDFNIDNSKILDKVEESHAQCRRLILKLSVDLNYRSKYMSEQYTNDIERIAKESKEYIKESIHALESYTGPSLLEKLIVNEKNATEVKDLAMQLLFEYIQPTITDDALVKFLEEFESTSNSQPTSGLTSCLLPFDSMSEDEDSEMSDSEYESSLNDSPPLNSQEKESVVNGN